MLNRVILMGRLTRDPELRRTQTGTPVASFALAVDRDFADRATGSRTADFIDIVAWRNTAEFVSKYFTKGRMAVVEGRLQIRTWQDKDGNNRRTAEVVADNVYFGDSKRDNNEGGYAPRSNGGSAYGAGSYGGNAYGGGYGNGGYAASPAQNAYAAPAAPSVSEFAELSDDDGDLPF